MIEISERITSVTTHSATTTPLWPGLAGRSEVGGGARATSGARVTLEFSRSVPLSPGQTVRLRYDFAGDGRLREFSGIAQLTHTVARRGHLVVFHYRLSHWIANRDKFS